MGRRPSFTSCRIEEPDMTGQTTLNLRLIAAMAEKTAQGVEQRELPAHKLEQAVAQMKQWLSEIE